MPRKSSHTVTRLLSMVGSLAGYICLAVLLGVLGSLAAIGVPVLGVLALISAVDPGGQLQFLPLVIALASCAVLRGFLHLGEQYLNHLIAFKLLAQIRQKVFVALSALAPAKLEGHDKGNLIAMVTTDVELIEVFYAHTISPVIIAVVVSLTICVGLAIINPLLAAVAALAYFAVGVLIPFVFSGRSAQAGRDFRDQSGALNSYVLDSLRGVKQSIQFGDGSSRAQQIQEQTELLAKKQSKLKSLEGVAAAVTTCAVVLFSGLMLVASVLLLEAGAIPASAAVIATALMLSSFGPVIALASLPGNLAHTFAAANRIFDLMDEQPAVKAVTNGVDADFAGMQMKDVNFYYPQVRQSGTSETSHNSTSNILTDFNLALPPQRIVGVTGKSGSGKSTALKLLMRFWDPTAGMVLFSQNNIKDVNTASLRQAQGYLTQDTQMFSGTILDNVLIANPSATAQEVQAACQKASIDDFISSLPSGYDTQVGELGDRLSSGEKQRIGLARMFLHDAPMVLLDEPTSNLDSLNESVILQSLYHSARQKTVVLVSHRTSTMRIAGQVFTVENGRVS
ncbi:ABC transporter ATP-binding protein [Actinomycetota bacterium]|nr:ABC transporter ATP-binding protein [Actinomycetota bacterium]